MSEGTADFAFLGALWLRGVCIAALFVACVVTGVAVRGDVTVAAGDALTAVADDTVHEGATQRAAETSGVISKSGMASTAGTAETT